MKLSASKDLEQLRVQARSAAETQAAIATRVALSAIYPVKLADAQAVKAGQPASQLLVEEAALRDITTDTLADLIIQKDQEAQLAIPAAELVRQTKLKQIAAANSEQELFSLMGAPANPMLLMAPK